jgi:hypothetical protein
MLNPGNFKGDAYGHATNQAGHFCIGLVLAAILAPLWGYPGALIVALGYGLLWEGLVQRYVLPWDSLEDTLNVAAGAAYAVSGALAVLGAWAALLAVGVWRRRT